MLYACCVNKSRASVRSCGSCFPQHKTLLGFQIIPTSFARGISWWNVLMEIWNVLMDIWKVLKFRGIGFVSAQVYCECWEPRRDSQRTQGSHAISLPTVPVALHTWRRIFKNFTLCKWKFEVKIQWFLLPGARYVVTDQPLCDGTGTLWRSEDGQLPVSSAKLDISHSDTWKHFVALPTGSIPLLSPFPVWPHQHLSAAFPALTL